MLYYLIKNLKKEKKKCRKRNGSLQGEGRTRSTLRVVFNPVGVLAIKSYFKRFFSTFELVKTKENCTWVES